MPVVEWDEIDAQAEREATAMKTVGKVRREWGVTSSRYAVKNGGGFTAQQGVRHAVRRAITQKS